ncbi:hypothetical protein [Paenarthrobacter sp. C1]|uniref:hypothetical protein n=1 Tax=Paenarthrobacter sp. C1 TaxID=3400220 RepID=UPI003BF53FFF
MTANRQPKGNPAGGQFAAVNLADTALSLRNYDDEERRLERKYRSQTDSEGQKP